MQNVIIKYYVPVFVFVFTMSAGMFLSAYFSNSGIEDIQMMVIAFIALNVGITFTFGTILYKFGGKWKDRYSKKVLNKKELKRFHDIGFYERSNRLLGYIDNYLIIIKPEKDSLGQRQWIHINIYFNPKMQNQFIPEYIFKKLNQVKPKRTKFSRNCAIIENDFTLFIPLKFNKIMSNITMVIKCLKNHDIEPISYWDIIEVEPELLKYDQQVNALI
ncbi:MAG: hypothetical protein HRU50_03590 [Winogradskyella sp.]|uniref:hypothetical protein n=1 Tax=Winogradskyella sp. TaxID=1883156 RepID=UPI0025CE4E7B|nr:hypothetical protein [Winogradskyella sp.]NRB59009.1 hypothetical protein [Winogradskyella sp.]